MSQKPGWSTGRQMLAALVLAAVASALLVLLKGPQLAGRTLVVGGMLVAIVIQFVGLGLLEKARSPAKAVLCVIVPGYFLFALQREGWYGLVVGIWLAALGAVVAGTILLA